MNIIQLFLLIDYFTCTHLFHYFTITGEKQLLLDLLLVKYTYLVGQHLYTMVSVTGTRQELTRNCRHPTGPGHTEEFALGW